MKPRLIRAALLLVLAACTAAPTSIATAPPSTATAAPPTATPPPQPTDTPLPPPTSTPAPTATPDLLISDLTPKQGAGIPPQGATGGGPWTTRIMLATSQDGLAFTRTNIVISDQAGVPNMLVDKDGRARIYYIDYGNGNIIAVAIQKSASEWVLRKVTITGLTQGGQPVDPTVVLLSDGQYRLYYMQAETGRQPTIYSAISSDGVTFAKEEGERYDPSDVYDPIVLQTTTGWLLWTGPDGKHSAKSKDGLIFEATGAFAVNGRAFMTWSTVAIPDIGYRIYGIFVGPGSGPGIYSAFSPDSVTWALDPGTRLAGQGDPSLEKSTLPDNGIALLKDGTYLLAYLAGIP